MFHVLVRQKVEHFDTWLKAFEANVPIRRAAGAQSAIVFRNPGDAREALIYMIWESEEKATAFAKSDQLIEITEAANSGVPLFLTESYHFNG